MKILIVSPTKLPKLTGNAITASRLSQSITALGHETKVITPGEYSLALVKEWKPDVAHLLHATKSFVQPLTVPYVITLTGTDVNVEMHRRQQLFHDILEDAAAVTSISRDLAEKVTTKHDIHVIHQSVLLPDSKLDVRKHFGLKRKRLVVLPSGVRSIKDPLYAVEEIEKVQEELDIDLLILGQVYENDLLEKLKRPWVTFGQLAHEEMSAAYKAADLVLNTSHAEGESNAVLEALSLNRPLLAADVPGNSIVPGPFRFAKLPGELAARVKEIFLAGEEYEISLPIPKEEAAAYMEAYEDALNSEKR